LLEKTSAFLVGLTPTVALHLDPARLSHLLTYLVAERLFIKVNVC